MNDIELAKTLMPLLQAAADGKHVEFHSKISKGGQWVTASLRTTVEAFFDNCPVRIKPEPKEWWEVRVRQDGACVGEFDTFDEARDYLDKTPQRGVYKIVHAQEVW